MTAIPSRHAALWPNERQALVLRAAVGEAEDAQAAFAALIDSVDLERHDVFDYATFRLLPLLYDSMHQLGVRHPVMARLKGIYRRAWYENHRLFHATGPIIAAIEAAGIDTMLLKGAPLVVDYYRNHALRPMSDIDVVVRPERVGDTIAVLRRLGLTRIDTAHDDDLKYRHAMLFRDAAGTEIDLHWHFMFEACNDAADAAFWAGARPLDFAGVATRQPDPALALVLIVIHGMRFNPMPPVRWIPDALAVIRGAGAALDWQRLTDFAEAQKITYRLGLGLRYLATEWRAPVPDHVFRALNTASVSLRERVENTIVFRDIDRLFADPVTKQWVIFADYCRAAPTRDPLKFLVGLSHYMRYRWRVGSRRDILIQSWRGMAKRLRGQAA
jgi:hypothetical protein